MKPCKTPQNKSICGIFKKGGPLITVKKGARDDRLTRLTQYPPLSMTECTIHRHWDTETPSHKISHDEYYEKWGTIDKIQHKLEHNASTLRPRIKHTRTTTKLSLPAALQRYRKTSISPPWCLIFQPFPHSGVLLEVTFS